MLYLCTSAAGLMCRLSNAYHYTLRVYVFVCARACVCECVCVCVCVCVCTSFSVCFICCSFVLFQDPSFVSVYVFLLIPQVYQLYHSLLLSLSPSLSLSTYD